MSITTALLEILACPGCKGAIFLDKDNTGLICPHCRLKYPVKNGVPIMVIGEAIRLDPGD